MEKFKIGKINKPTDNKQVIFSITPDNHRWIRVLAAENDTTNGEILHQIINYARNNEERKR
jgi:hypothetical protein